MFLYKLKNYKEKKRTPTSQEINSAKNQIVALLKNKYHLKTSDLPKNYQNWGKELEKLDRKEKIETFVQELEKAIQQQIAQQKHKKSIKPNQNKSTLSLPAKICLGGGISLITVIGLFIFVRIVVKGRKVFQKVKCKKNNQ